MPAPECVRSVVSPQPIERRGFTINDAAAYLSIHRTSVYRLINKGELRLRKIGGRSIILRDDLDRLLEGAPADKAAA